MKIGSLSEKLILYFVLLGAGAIIVISLVSFYSTKDALIDRTFDQLTSLRIVKKNQVEKFYNDRVRDVEFLAGTDEVRKATSKVPPAVPGILSASKYRMFGQYFTSFYIFRERVAVARGCFSDGTASGITGIPAVILEKINRVLPGRETIVSDVTTDPIDGRPCQFIATAVYGEDAPENLPGSFIVLSVSLDAINSIMLNNDPQSGLGLSGETYLVGTDYLMRSASRFQAGSIMKTSVSTQPVILAMSGRQGRVTTGDYRNIPVLSSYDLIRVHGLKWAILAEIDVQEAMVPIYETRSRILMLSIIILLVFFGFVLFISKRITKPLIRLRNATVNLGKGQYDINLPVGTDDEIGALTRSFNIMARQIKEKTTELQMERSGRMRSVFDGEEMERQRLSRELHDGIGQSLIAIKLRLENLLYQDVNDTRTSIQELKKYFDQIIDEVRRISNDLMPSVLEAFSIPIAFRNLFTETEEHSDLKISFEAKGNFDDLDTKIKTYIYRLMQEALNNIVKHADAREVKVNLERSPEHLTLVISDDGKGFLPETAAKEGGNGIHNMRERANLLHGQIEIRSAPATGATIILTVPIIDVYVKNQDFPRG